MSASATSAPSWVESDEDGDLYAEALANGANDVVLSVKKRVETYLRVKKSSTGTPRRTYILISHSVCNCHFTPICMSFRAY